jgi:hypothetical protein
MKSAQEILRDESGSTIVVVMIIAIVMLVTAYAAVELAAQDAALANRDLRASQAFYNAEAGVERAQAWLLGQNVLPTARINPFGDYAEGLGGGLYFTYIEPHAGTERPTFTVISVATVDGHTRAVAVDMTPTAFTDYLYFTNSDVGPASPGYFKTGDIVDGPVHINDQLCIWGDPVFTGHVEATGSLIKYENDGSPIETTQLTNAPADDPDFQDGCTLGATHMQWLDQPDVNELMKSAGLNVGSAEVVFGRDDGSGPMLGWLSYRKINTTDPWIDIEISSFNGILYANGDCSVRGIVDGKVTLASNTDIAIVDDLIYAGSTDGVPDADCDDVCGLVASVRVFVEDSWANQSDCVVHAHLLAVNNQASLVENYNQGIPRGTLTVWGGMAQDKWGPVGTGYYDQYGEFHVLTGYVRDVHYDWRLSDSLPPGYNLITFPGSSYTRLGWREITPPFEVQCDVRYTHGEEG